MVNHYFSINIRKALEINEKCKIKCKMHINITTHKIKRNVFCGISVNNNFQFTCVSKSHFTNSLGEKMASKTKHCPLNFK